MHSIYKYPLPVVEKHCISLPIGAKIIRVGEVDGLFYLWAMVDMKLENTEPRYLEFYKTGQDILTNPDQLVFLGTCKLFIAQELCLYVFEVTRPTQPYTT